ncbi:hypothetical protein AEP_03475 [Curvibacter sp. AEP1-3]|uniref:NAD-dependent epimerase/dehydratase family protein n=1 Tax=Curvibacter sp. AEP1-3 TaxID=1844971 RepID=UPI000B3CF208|nr:NAD(P)-dependent oxidoreductase [Curvibacter sp. AEP1-3]ARV20395.1 hypothetical protein AEP_03475 [Curvibacter sp. AEP1-3]
MTKSRILVLGGSGFVGKEVARQLSASDWAVPVVASRFAKSQGGLETIQVDTLDSASLAKALVGIQGVINCVAGEGRAISDGAAILVKAALAASKPRIIHMSSMSVYGTAEGVIDESHICRDDLGWYGHAKIEAEKRILEYAELGGEAVILRPGCIVGPGSRLWVDRIKTWLKAGRLGDLGAYGDGPANLVDVRDVAQAAVRGLALKLGTSQCEIFNIASPDSPRWNEYFSDLALQIGAIPLKTFGTRRLQLDAYAVGVPTKVVEKILQRILKKPAPLPEAIPPSLLGLWQQQIYLDSSKATSLLGLNWTKYGSKI